MLFVAEFVDSSQAVIFFFASGFVRPLADFRSGGLNRDAVVQITLPLFALGAAQPGRWGY